MFLDVLRKLTDLTRRCSTAEEPRGGSVGFQFFKKDLRIGGTAKVILPLTYSSLLFPRVVMHLMASQTSAVSLSYRIFISSTIAMFVVGKVSLFFWATLYSEARPLVDMLSSSPRQQCLT